MNKSQRIWLSSGNSNNDKYIKFKLERDVDTLEIMSLKLDTKESYQNFNANYGVIVGRVNANNGIGVPNAKISIFIPLDENDENNGDIVSVYPFKTPRDKNNQGKRYNLLPRVSRIDPATGDIKPKQPFGSFPTKEEILTNPTNLEVYKKYYKFSTVTNNSGDYMIYGVPIGTQTVHMSCDITDIGEYSMTPAAMVTNLGYSSNLFTDNNTRIKSSDDLNDLPHIETQEISVDVIPFWGDSENFIIGITRQDFRIRAELLNTFVIFGTAFTDGDEAMWGESVTSNANPNALYRVKNPGQITVFAGNKRTGIVNEKIYYYPNTIDDSEIDPQLSGSGTLLYQDRSDDMLLLNKTQYSSYKREGDFVYIINCNRKKVITNEIGDKVEVSNDYNGGIYTEFKGFMTLSIDENEVPMNFSNLASNSKVEPYRYKIKIPQRTYDIGQTFQKEKPGTIFTSFYNQQWRGQFGTFKGGQFYSVAKFHGTVYNDRTSDSQYEGQNFNDNQKGFFNSDSLNIIERSNGESRDWRNNVGIIITSGTYGDIDNSLAQFPSNCKDDDENLECFVGNWINFAIYLMQNGKLTENYNQFKDLRTNTNFCFDVKDKYYFIENDQKIAAGEVNTKHFARSDLHYTDFINVPVDHIIDFLNYTNTSNLKGFTLNNIIGDLKDKIINGDYRNGQSQCPKNGGLLNAKQDNPVDTNYYFFKGMGNADCIEYLRELGLVNLT